MDIKAFFSTQTRRGRAVRTAIQAFLGVLTFVVGILTIPGLSDALTQAGVVVQATTLATWIGVVSYTQNALEALIKYLWGE